MKSWSADLQNGKFDRDPVIRAFLGGSMGTNPPSDLQRIKEREPLFKHAVVSALAQGIGVSYNDANAFIKQWALSSNKGLTAQVIQKATADEFDLPFSDWQRTRYDKYEQLWADAIHLQSVNMLLTKKLDAQDEAAITKAILDTLPFPEAAKADLAHLWPKDFQFAQSKDNYDLVESRMAQVADIANHVRYLAAERTKRALRFLYEETQRDLQAQGIDEVILYRGFSSSTVADLPQGSSVTVSANTLSSWSADDGIASLFASRYDSDSDTVDPAGAVFAMRVPAKRIFSTPRTGFGCLHEFEFVVLGHDQDEATVASTIHGDKETFIDLGDLWEEEKAANLPPIVALDNSDDNADWIKQVHGGEAQRRELAIHEELAARFAAKGGPGSGFHDHAGRPGERGGSAPSGLPPTSVPSVEEIRENTEGFVDDLHALNFETDPVIRGFVGGNDGTGDGYLTHLTRRAPQLKHAVVTKLADALGVDYKDANAFIKEWANSSNEGFIAQTIQKAAADEFGVPQSDWQRKQYDESVASWEKTLQERLDRITHFGQVTADQADALCSSCLKDAPFFERAWDGIKERFPEGITLDKTDDAEVVAAYRERVETAVRQSRADQVDLTRRALRFLYDETQRDLKDLRLDEVLLYRGYVTQGAASLDLGETVTVASNALASWSAERETAEMFATGLSFHEGAAFAVKVPAARVFSTPRTGFGCLLEWEFVLLGGAKDAARVVFTIGNGEKHTLKSLDTPEDTMAKRVINLDDSDTNADWIKRVRGGESQRRELAIHEELARANGQPVTDPTEEGWPDVPETNEDDAGDPSTD